MWMVSEKKISKKSSRTLEADKYSANNAQPFLLCTEGVPALAAGCQIVLEAACWWMPRNLKTWGFEIHEELSSPIASILYPPAIQVPRPLPYHGGFLRHDIYVMGLNWDARCVNEGFSATVQRYNNADRRFPRKCLSERQNQTK